ncbi:MAG TPA: acetamidase/formamidase family protein, partial [Dehalococcoidia bacterium]|nr:acetamidase/formamidase family protein [Dehalococcoidia bacterium]
TGTLRREDQIQELLSPKGVNPATGPIFVRGAQPGDTLAVAILDIRPESPGLMLVRPKVGALGDIMPRPAIKLLPFEGDTVAMESGVRLQLDPMIGVLGVAPKEGAIGNMTPGPHGANMDCKLIKKGATVYLPVEVEGALLGVGDVHARQGDGEIVICGIECNAEVELEVKLLKGRKLPLPFLENREIVAAIWSAPDLDEAASIAIHRMADFLTGVVGLPIIEAGRLMSTTGDLRICQVVDPLKTCRMEFPKEVLRQLGISLEESLK